MGQLIVKVGQWIVKVGQPIVKALVQNIHCNDDMVVKLTVSHLKASMKHTHNLDGTDIGDTDGAIYTLKKRSLL